MNKPNLLSITLKNFFLMRDGSPIYYAENFGVKNGKLIPMHHGVKVVDDQSAGFSAMTVVQAMDSILEGSNKFAYMIDSKARLFLKQIDAASNGDGLAQNIDADVSYPDIKLLGSDSNSRAIFTQAQNVGRIHRGSASGGSATTLDDNSGVDFTKMSLTTGDVVYNITTGKHFTINSGGVAATELTITSSDGGSFSAGNRYCIIDPNWKSLSDNAVSDKIDYGRQIIEFDQDYYILDGQNLARVPGGSATPDVETLNAAWKPLESGWIGRCGASNGNTILIGAIKNGKGKLFLWDKSSSGWLNKLALDNSPQAIRLYGNGYVFISGGTIYYTDGYSMQKLSDFPDSTVASQVSVKPNGMLIISGNIIINAYYNLFNRQKTGIYIFNIAKLDFVFCPFEFDGALGHGKTSRGSASGAIFFDNSSTFNRILYSFGTGGGAYFANNYVVSYLNLGEKNNQGTFFTEMIPLGKNASIKKIEVILSPELEEYGNVASPAVQVNCKISDGTRPLWRYVKVSGNSAALNAIKVYGSYAFYARAKKGDEVLFNQGKNGFLRRYITDIVNPGTDNETWTLDSDLPNLTKADEEITVLPFQLFDMSPVTIDENIISAGILEFFPRFIGDNLQMEIYVLGTQYPVFAIESLKIYFE